MGLIGLLKFALICIDFLAWPVIGLGYPLFASIRAIESGPKYHLRKLAMIPFWSSIELVVIFWLVIPEFDVASLAYQSLVRPSSSVNLQQLTNRFYIPKKKKLHKIETFLDEAEKYIQENGSEALQKLISSKGDCKEPINSQRDIQVLESEEKVVAAASKLLKGPEAAQKANETPEAKGKTASAEMKLVHNAESSSVAWVLKGTDAAAEVEAMTPPQDIQPETPPPKQIEQEWTCILCNVKTISESRKAFKCPSWGEETQGHV